MNRPFFYQVRKFYNKSILLLIFLLSFIACVPFFFIVFFVFQKGLGVLNLSFFTQLPPTPDENYGGLANGMVGSLKIVGLACLLGVPWALFLGVFLSEKPQHKIAQSLRFVVDLSISVPSIVIGIFVYSFLVSLFGFSAYAGSFALLMILIPIVAKSTEEILKMIPHHIREAGLALGIPKWKVIFRIILPGTLTMLLSGVILALARIAGETAPLLFTALGNHFFSKSLGEPTATLPVQIYEFSKSGFPNLENMAWGGALVLISFVFLINFGIRFFLFLLRSRNLS
ncbi:MAG: phosphate ABC transporter permease PstA [Bdellovibrionales bacterium]|nr:phosphate ABC transporter permease PstA [Bdellovibrionales bacterium]